MEGDLESTADIYKRLFDTLKFGSTPETKLMGSEGYACLADVAQGGNFSGLSTIDLLAAIGSKWNDDGNLELDPSNTHT